MVKKLFLPLIIVCVVAGGIVLALNSGCKGGKCEVAVTAPTPTPTVQLSIAQQVADTGGILVDVRTPEEFASSHAKNAVNLPLADIQNGIYPDVSKDIPIYLYCRTGNRAEQAKTILEQNGFTNVTNIGGLSDWQAQGGEVISD